MLRNKESAWSSLQPAFSGRGFVPISDINSVDITAGYCYVGLVSTDVAVVSWIRSHPIPTDRGELIKEEGRWDDRLRRPFGRIRPHSLSYCVSDLP